MKSFLTFLLAMGSTVTLGDAGCIFSYRNPEAIQSFHTPVAYDNKKCKVVFNKERCDYDVVQKDDPSKVCSDVRRTG